MNPIISILKAISDETRLELLKLMMYRELCGKSLARCLGISEAAVSQHIKILREAGLVHGDKRGYRMHYVVKKETIRHVIQELECLVQRASLQAEKCRRIHITNGGFSEKEIKSLCCEFCCRQSGHPNNISESISSNKAGMGYQDEAVPSSEQSKNNNHYM